MNTPQLSTETSLALMQASQTKQTAAMDKNQARIEEKARDFEAVFITEMMKPMFEGIETDELFGGGKGEEIFRGMMLDEYGKDIASLNTTGIQTQVKNKLIEMQSERTAQTIEKYQEKSGNTLSNEIIAQEPTSN
ncbi:MAG: rod-binding protein [Alphaproteobacteria bacterium]